MTVVGLGRRPLIWVSAGLSVSVFAVPMLVVAVHGLTSESDLETAAGSAFVRAGASGARADARGLVELVSLWRDFHLIKAALAVLLVLALLRLSSVLSLQARVAGPRRWALAAYGGVLASMLAALTIALANLQGALAPLASTASLLPRGRTSGELGAVLGELRQAVQVDPASPAGVAGKLLADFERYHAVFAILAAVVGALLTAHALRAAVEGWRRRRRRALPPSTWLWRFGLFCPAGAFFLLVATANASTWLHPGPALVASLGG